VDAAIAEEPEEEAAAEKVGSVLSSIYRY